MRLILNIFAGILGIFLATKFVPGVSLEIIPGENVFFGIALTERWQIFVFIGTILGLINLLIKPILNLVTLIKPVLDIVTLPLKIATLNLFSLILNIAPLILNMAVIWILDILFNELQISGFIPLFWTTIICWGINLILGVKK